MTEGPSELDFRRQKWVRFRLSVLAAFVALFAFLVVRRAYELQVARAPALRVMAQEQYMRRINLAPKRGTIYDRNGAELAVSVDVDSVWASPRELQRDGADPRVVARRLQELLGVDAERIATRLSSDRYFVWVKRHVSPQLADRIRDAALPGVHLDQEARRFYPARGLAAHVLGFANIDGEGIEGLELSFEDSLRGEHSAADALRDSRGRVVYSESFFDDTTARGADLTLTIDSQIQRVAEREIALAVQTYEAKSGSVVVMDPTTGDVLAMANFPTFDPNTAGSAPASHRRNRAITDRFEPGSTVKAFTVAAAINARTISASEQIDCEDGQMAVDEYVIHDTSRHSLLTPAQILAYSSNIGAAKVGSSLGREGLYRAFRSFGFGQRTEIGLPGEAAGILRDYRRWYEMDAATISFGQGMSVTTLQIAAAMSVIANGGQLVSPRIVARVHSGGEGRELPPTRPATRVISARTSRMINEMLTAVTGPGGTAVEASIDGYLVAGKTGTAQKAAYLGGGYARDRWVASFVGFAPAENPRVVICVVVDEPMIAHYGGVVAGPAFRRIGAQALRELGVPASSGGDVLLARERESRRARRAPRVESNRSPVTPVSEQGLVTVPDLQGLPLRAALTRAQEASAMLSFEGAGIVRDQEPRPGSQIPAGDAIHVRLAAPGETLSTVVLSAAGVP